MATTEVNIESRHESKTRILNAAMQVIRSKGYSATRIEDICEAAGLTKGSFFHHFSSKEELAIAAADYWSEMTSALFAAAPYHAPADPVERVLAYVDFRKADCCRGTAGIHLPGWDDDAGGLRNASGDS